MTESRIEVENVNTPGKTTRADAAKYHAMRAAMLAVLPLGAPRLTAFEVKDRARPRQAAPGRGSVPRWGDGGVVARMRAARS